MRFARTVHQSYIRLTFSVPLNIKLRPSLPGGLARAIKNHLQYRRPVGNSFPIGTLGQTAYPHPKHAAVAADGVRRQVAFNRVDHCIFRVTHDVESGSLREQAPVARQAEKKQHFFHQQFVKCSCEAIGSPAKLNAAARIPAIAPAWTCRDSGRHRYRPARDLAASGDPLLLEGFAPCRGQSAACQKGASHCPTA